DELPTVQRSQPPLPLLDLVPGDALILLGLLGGLDLERTLGVGQALALGEQLRLPGASLPRIEFVNQGSDLALLVGVRLGECCVHRFGNLDAGAFGPAIAVESGEVADADVRTKLARVGVVGGPTLS